MKKLTLFLVVCLGFVFLSACFEGTSTNGTSIDTLSSTSINSVASSSTDSVASSSIEVMDNTLVNVHRDVLETTSITTGFEFNLYAMQSISLIKDKYFYVYFTGIIYEPVINRVCILFDYQDEDYERANYYMIGRKKGTLLTAQQLTFVVPNETGSHGGCFTFMTEATIYEILIGKIDRDDLQPSTYMEAVAVVEFADSHFSDRYKVGLSTLTFDPSTDYTYDTIPSESLDISIEDADQNITNVELELIEAETNILLETYTIPQTMLTWANDKLFINNFVINDLAPYLDYRVKVYVSGFDGMDDFSSILVQNQRFKSQSITDSGGYRRHGFFAEVITIIPGDVQATMRYIAVNNQQIISSTDQQPYNFVLNVYDTTDQLIFTTILDVTTGTLAIPNPFAEVGNKIKIITDRDDIVLHQSIIETPPPDLHFNLIKNGQLSGIVIQSSETINSIAFFVYLLPESNPIEMFETTTFSDQGEFNEYLMNFRFYQNRDQVLVFYQINYGPVEDPMFFARHVWVQIN